MPWTDTFRAEGLHSGFKIDIFKITWYLKRFQKSLSGWMLMKDRNERLY